MQHQVMGYDRSATMLSPDGHILQVEYAEKTVRLGSASIGVNCNEGLVIVADKGKKDELMIPESADKIYEIDDHIMASAAGILSDGRILVNHVRVSAQQHRVSYDSPIDVESVIREISDIKQQYTQHPGVRPFAVSIMVAGRTDGKNKLYTSDITGNYFEYKAISIGKHDDKINESLKKKYRKDMDTNEAIKMCLGIFKEILGEDFDINRFNVAVLKKDDERIKKLNKDEIKKFE